MHWGNRKNAHIGDQHKTKANEQTMLDELHVGRARVNPRGRFRRPMDVVEATGIPVAEKRSILKAWEVDERALQRAEDEGMGGGEHAHLQRVQEALGRLEGSGDRTPG